MKIKFKNKNLENKILEILSVKELTNKNIAKLTTLTFKGNIDDKEDIFQKDISKLFKYCNLKSLQLSHVKMDGIVFENCNIKRIKLEHINLRNVYFGKDCKIELLAIKDCLNVDVSNLANLKTLKTLYIPRDMRHISSFANLVSLESLCIEGDYTENMVGYKERLEEIENIVEAQNLKVLSLKDCCIDNISFIKKMKKLTKVDLSGNPIKDPTPLTKLKFLNKVNLNNTEIGVESADILINLGIIAEITVQGTPLETKLKGYTVDIRSKRLKAAILKSLGKDRRDLTQKITEFDLYKTHLSSPINTLMISLTQVDEYIKSEFNERINIGTLLIKKEKETLYNLKKYLGKFRTDLNIVVDSPMDLIEEEFGLLEERTGIKIIIDGEEFSVEEVEEMKKIMSKILCNISKNDSDLEKIYRIYTLLGMNFDKFKPKATNLEERKKYNDLLSIFRKGLANETGAALLTKKLLRHANIESVTETGISETQNINTENVVHTWNKVKLDGQWYNVKWIDDVENIRKSADSLKYFLVSDDTLNQRVFNKKYFAPQTYDNRKVLQVAEDAYEDIATTDRIIREQRRLYNG